MKRSAQESIVVNVGTSKAYEVWRDFENFPHFMEGVVELTMTGDRTFRLLSDYQGRRFESQCEIVLDIPGRRLAWRTLSGADSLGVVRFEFEAGGTTRITLAMQYDPATGWADQEFMAARLAKNLRQFKEFVERNGAAGEGTG